MITIRLPALQLEVQDIALLGSVVLLLVIINLIRRERLKEGYSIVWFLIGLVIVLFAAFESLLDVFAKFVGIFYAPAALFLILITGLLLISINFSVLISKYDRRIRELAQEGALLRQMIEKIDKKRSSS